MKICLISRARRQVKRHQQVWTTTAVPRMASDSGTALLRCMQPSVAEQRSRGAAVEPGPKGTSLSIFADFLS